MAAIAEERHAMGQPSAAEPPVFVFTQPSEEAERSEGEGEGLGEGLSPVFQPASLAKGAASKGAAPSARLARHLHRSLSSLERKGRLYSCFYKDPHSDPNVQRVLEAVKSDQEVLTHPQDNRKRRTILLHRPSLAHPFGFTLESYVLLRGLQLEQARFVANVEVDGFADRSGLRAGDVVLSLDGQNVTELSHRELVECLSGGLQFRAVVLFDNAAAKVELALRALKLESLLELKRWELRRLEARSLSSARNLSSPLLSSPAARALLSVDDSFHSALSSVAPEEDVFPEPWTDDEQDREEGGHEGREEDRVTHF